MHSDTLTHAPDPPAHLPQSSWPDWYRVTDELIKAGNGRPAYLDAVEMYCRSLHLERQAFAEATAAGLVYQAQPKGKEQQSKPHPAWRVYLNLQAQTRRLARSLMLTPQDNQPAKGKRTAIRRKGSGGIGTRHT